jgi:hypothetical protein
MCADVMNIIFLEFTTFETLLECRVQTIIFFLVSIPMTNARGENFCVDKKRVSNRIFEEKVKKLMENKYKVYYVSMSQWQACHCCQAHTKILKTIISHLKSSGYFFITSSFFSF